MQFQLLTAVTFAIVYFSQLSPVHTNLIDDLIKQAEDAIENIDNVIQVKVNNSLIDLESLKINCSSQGQNAIAAANSSLTIIIANAQKEIDEIKTNAEASGIDISECLINVTNGFKQVFEEFIQNEIHCVTNEIDHGLNIIKDAIRTVNNTLTEVADLPGQLEACGRNLFSFTCIGNLIKDIAELLISLPLEITKEVTDATAFVVGLKVRLEACAAIQIAKGAFSAAEEIVTNVKTCAADLTPIIKGNISEQAEKAIEKLKNVTKEKIEVSLDILVELKTNCTLQKQEAIEGAKLQLNLTIINGEQHIDEIKKTAEENETDITQCLVNVTNDFRQVFETFLQNEINCVTEEINQGLNIINNAIEIINSSSKDGETLQNKLKACGTKPSSIVCVQNVILEAENLTISLPLEIAKEVTDATVFVAGLKFRLETCAAIQIAKDAVSAVKEIVEDVTTCADALITGTITNTIKELTEQAKEAIEKLNNITQVKVQVSLEVLVELKTNCTLQKREAIEGARLELNLTIVGGQQKIDEINKKAEENGTDISQCLVNVTSDFKEVSETFLQNEINCVTKEINQGLNIINNAIQIVTGSSKEVEILQDKLTACGTNLSSIVCIKNVITEAENLTISLPLEITNEVTNATLFVVGLKFRLETCAAIQIAKGAVSAVIEIVEDVTSCADNLMKVNITKTNEELIEQAEDTIGILINVTHEKYNLAKEILVELKGNCTLQGQEAIEGAKLELNLTIVAGQQKIDDIKKLAEENGTDITPCLVNVTNDFKQVSETFIQNEINCVTEEINQGLNIINNANQIINNSFKEAETLPEKLKACGTKPSSIVCIQNVITEATNLTISLPLEITKEVTNATVFVVGLKFRLETCAAIQIAKGAVSAVIEINKAVTLCADNLITGNITNTIKELTEQAKEAIEKLNNVTQVKVQVSLEVLVELKTNCTLQKQEAIEGAKLQLNLTIVNGQQQIDEIKKIAKENETDITQCLVNVTNDFKQVSETFLQNEINCVTKEINQGLNIINNTSQIVTDSSKEVETLQEKLNACGTKPSSIVCIQNVITEADNLIISLPLAITKEVTDATVFVVGLKFRLETCAAIQIAKGAVSAVNKIVKLASICADNLMKDYPGISIGELIKQAKEAIEKLKNGTQDKIQVSLDILVELETNCTLQKQEAIEGAKLQLNLTIVNGQQKIDEIKTTAEENGTDISQCLVNITSDFMEVSETFLQNEITCVTKEINQGLNIINNATEIINNSSKEIETLSDKLKACGTNVSSRVCIQNVILEAENLTISLPLNITKEVTDATVFVVGLKFRLETCAAIQIAKGAVSAVNKIVKLASTCADNLMKTQGNISKPIKELIQQAEEAIAILKNVTQNNTQVSLEILVDIKAICISQEQAAIKEAKLQLNLTIIDGQHQIDEIKKIAEENETDISQCLVNVTSDFKEVTETFLQNEINCVTKETNQSLNIINNTTEVINNSSKEIETLQVKLNACGTEPSSNVCIQNVITESKNLTTSLPLAIAKEVTDATVFVAGLKFRLETCTAIQIANGAVSAVNEIVEDVTSCAENLMKVNITKTIEELSKQAEEAIEILKNVTHEKIQVSLEVLVEFKYNYTLQKQEVIEEAKLELNLTIVDGQQKIDEIEKKAKENETNISQCLVNVTNDFKQVSESFLQNEINCVTEEINKGLNIINNAIEIINSSSKEVENLQKKLNACGTKPSSSVCIQNVITEAKNLTISLPLEITKEVTNATVFVVELTFRLETCAAIQIAKGAVSAVNEIVENVTTCVENLTVINIGIDDLIKIAEEEIENLQITLENYQTILEQYKNNCTSQGQTAINEAKAAINITITNAQIETDEIKKEAEKNGANISQCLRNVTNGFGQVLDNFVHDEIECVTNEINQSIDIINHSNNTFRKSSKLIAEYQESLKNFKNSGSCSKLIPTLKIINEISSAITIAFNDATTFVSGLKLNLGTCTSAQLAKGANEVGKIVLDVSKCAIDLLANVTICKT